MNFDARMVDRVGSRTEARVRLLDPGNGRSRRTARPATFSRKEPGGWIVICKSTGRMKVVEFEGGDDEISGVMQNLERNVTAIMSSTKFQRSFEPIEDHWRGKPTGLKRLCKTCEFCSYLGSCYPDAEYKAHPNSEAKNPPHYWFVKDY